MLSFLLILFTVFLYFMKTKSGTGVGLGLQSVVTLLLHMIGLVHSDLTMVMPSTSVTNLQTQSSIQKQYSDTSLDVQPSIPAMSTQTVFPPPAAPIPTLAVTPPSATPTPTQAVPTPSAPVTPTTANFCRQWYSEDGGTFGNLSQWISFLVPCPWTLLHAELDFRFMRVSSSIESGECYIQRFHFQIAIGERVVTPETECCYASRYLHSGVLIRARVYLRYLFNFPYSPFQLRVQPYDWCCRQPHSCLPYLDVQVNSLLSCYWPPRLG